MIVIDVKVISRSTATAFNSSKISMFCLTKRQAEGPEGNRRGRYTGLNVTQFPSNSNNIYIKMGRGALLFKGDTAGPTRKKSSNSKHSAGSRKRSLNNDVTTTTSEAGTTTINNSAARTHTVVGNHIDINTGSNPCSPQPPPSTSPKILVGRGKITVSGTVITGYDTKFITVEGLQVGDAILLGAEMRIITMRLSDISLNVSSAFPASTITSIPVSYSYICKPRSSSNVIHETELKQQAMAKERANDLIRHQNAFTAVVASNTAGGTAALNTTTSNGVPILYRERTEHGNYRIKQINSNQSSNGNNISKNNNNMIDRSDWLAIRTKKTSDKYC
jgi:hypothetical protein